VFVYVFVCSLDERERGREYACMCVCMRQYVFVCRCRPVRCLSVAPSIVQELAEHFAKLETPFTSVGQQAVRIGLCGASLPPTPTPTYTHMQLQTHPQTLQFTAQCYSHICSRVRLPLGICSRRLIPHVYMCVCLCVCVSVCM
jgi:hypothetical protein